MTERSSVSINTIARRADVSRNTVSLALRGSDRVRPETRELVLRAAEQLGYRPNRLARALVTGQSGLLGVLIPRLDYSYMPRILQAAQDVAVERDYALLFLSHQNDPRRLPEQLEYFAEHRVEGLIIFPPVPPPPAAAWRAIRQTAIRAVFLEPTPGAPGPVFGVREGEAGRMAVRRMADLGHRNLALVGPRDDYFADLHAAAVDEAARELGLPPPRRWAAPDTVDGGSRAAALYLRERSRPTGVVCFSDAQAAGFVQALTSAGVGVPAEVSVTGVDDSPLAQAAAVPLTTLRAPAAEMGRQAALALIEPDSAPPGDVVLAWRWVERASLDPPPLQKE